MWLAARYLPHIFRWLRIAPALDPAITLTNACLGYWFRQYGSSAILSPGYSDVEMRQAAVVQQVFRAWVPLLGIDKVGNLLQLVAGQYTRKSHLRFLQQLKTALYQAIQEHALTYLRSRVSQQLLPGGVSWAWLASLASIPKAAANGIARFAVLRWAVNEDDDECLRLRTQGYFLLLRLNCSRKVVMQVFTRCVNSAVEADAVISFWFVVHANDMIPR